MCACGELRRVASYTFCDFWRASKLSTEELVVFRAKNYSGLAELNLLNSYATSAIIGVGANFGVAWVLPKENVVDKNAVDTLEGILREWTTVAGLTVEVLTGDWPQDCMVCFWVGDNTDRVCDVLFKWIESSVLFRVEVSLFQLKMIERAVDAADRYIHKACMSA